MAAWTDLVIIVRAPDDLSSDQIEEIENITQEWVDE
jgi:hypothetical protein